MKVNTLPVLSMCACFAFGCAEEIEAHAPLHEGAVYTMQWTDGTGETHGMSRLSMAESVPGGEGSWNMNLYARVYATHVEVVNLGAPDLGPQIIPMERLDFIQFGDGGITFPPQRSDTR